MNLQRLKQMLPFLCAGAIAWAEAPVAVSRTFLLKGVECGGCVYLVEYSLNGTKGVSSVQVNQGVECCAVVTFNPLVVSEQKVAQSVRDATSLHGEPYTAHLKMKVRGYARNADAVQALFLRWKDSVRVEVTDFEKGELLLSFLPLKSGGSSTASPGWSLGLWEEAARTGLPAGVTWEVLRE